MKYILVFLSDWANGLFALLFAGYLTTTELQWWFIPIALLLAHLPDVDAIPELLRRGKVAASAEHESDHRTLLHYPIVALPVCTVLALYGGFWGLVAAIVIPLHLLNDLYGTGWGLQLLWPFHKNSYKVLARRVNTLKPMLIREGVWNSISEEERRLRFVVSWSESELPGYIRRWGKDDWIDDWYMRLNWVNGVEYVLFLVACILMVLQLQ